MSGSSLRSVRSSIAMQARLARRGLRRLRQAKRYGRRLLRNSPILFANSFPKSGTHLLTQIMHGFCAIGPAVDSGLPAVVTYDGETGRLRQEEEIVNDLKRLLPGDIAYGHVHALPIPQKILCQEGFASYFILRDPRDVVVSHVHYLTEMESRHIHHLYYNQVLSDFDARLSASIAGVSAAELARAGTPNANQPSLPDIAARFEPFMGWLEHPEILLLRYEDLMSQRQQSLQAILDHAVQRGFHTGVSLEEALHILEDSINPQRSPTFRSGKIGGWRASFLPFHKELFKQVSGDLLQRLGYETDASW